MSERPAGSSWGPLEPLGEALRFLTILPLPGLPPPSPAGFARAMAFLPLGGGIIGALLDGIGLLVSLFWHAEVRAVALVVAWGVLTAGLHLDGLSDTFDAVMSWRSRERKLEIMRDSRIGAMGALALIAVLALKVVLLGHAGPHWLSALALAPVLGRWATLYGICSFPPARADGLGQSVQIRTNQRNLLVGTLSTLLLAVLLEGLRGLLAMALVWLASHLLARWWTGLLGGLTGDTYGALCELAEVVALATMTAAR